MDGTHDRAVDKHETVKSLVKELATDYRRYFNVDTIDVIKQFANSVEENLIVLEDFCAILDVIRNESAAHLEHLLPQISTKCKEMELLFAQIDSLELFIGKVKEQINKMEEEVTKAEQTFESKSKVKAFISSLLMTTSKPKSPSSSPQKEPSIRFEEIFRTEDFIVKHGSNPLSEHTKQSESADDRDKSNGSDQ